MACVYDFAGGSMHSFENPGSWPFAAQCEPTSVITFFALSQDQRILGKFNTRRQ